MKNAIINVHNVNDDECFKWAVTVARMPKHANSGRLSNALKEHSKMFDWTGVRFPTPLKDIRKFSKNNNVEINVFGYEDGNVYPLFILGNSKNTIDLLYLREIDDESDTGVKSHYVWIKSMSRLLSSKINNHQHKRYFCRRCLNDFADDVSLSRHEGYCSKVASVKTIIPVKGKGKGDILKFKNMARSLDVPFLIYADFESFIEKTAGCEGDPNKSHTTQCQHHTPSGWCYHVKCFDDSIHWESPMILTKIKP